MKKMLLFVVIIAAGLAACNTRSGQDPSKTLSEADTAGLADFQEWKMLNERKDASLYMQPAAPVSTVKKTSAPANTVNTVPAPQKAKKQGWSKAAKGTAIGTATGATAGAIIFKRTVY
ncbi:MAG: hypothetical protein WDN26_13010 [Chitinophagaceae bacterium]